MPLAQNSCKTKKKTSSQGLPHGLRCWFRGTLRERTRFHPNAIYVRFMVDKLAPWQMFQPSTSFTVNPPMPHCLSSNIILAKGNGASPKPWLPSRSRPMARHTQTHQKKKVVRQVQETTQSSRNYFPRPGHPCVSVADGFHKNRRKKHTSTPDLWVPESLAHFLTTTPNLFQVRNI